AKKWEHMHPCFAKRTAFNERRLVGAATGRNWPPVAHQSPINNLSPPKLHNCRPRRPTRIPSVGLRQECEQLQTPGQAPKSRGRAQYRLNLRRAPTQSFKKATPLAGPNFIGAL